MKEGLQPTNAKDFRQPFVAKDAPQFRALPLSVRSYLTIEAAREGEPFNSQRNIALGEKQLQYFSQMSPDEVGQLATFAEKRVEKLKGDRQISQKGTVYEISSTKTT